LTYVRPTPVTRQPSGVFSISSVPPLKDARMPTSALVRASSVKIQLGR